MVHLNGNLCAASRAGAITPMKPTCTPRIVRNLRRSNILLVLLSSGLIGGCSSGSSKPSVVGTPLPKSSIAGESDPEKPEPVPSVTTEPVASSPEPVEWISLFDGKTLGNWKSTQFGGEGEVTVEEGKIVLDRGDDMTGVTWRGDVPARVNYEIELEAQRVAGNDFFCGLTFPVGDDPCSLICGGWGGGVTGLSSLDGEDAAHNETSQWINYDKDRWYRIRLRVTESSIQAWLDDKQIVEVSTVGRKIGIRSEVDPSKPLGISTWRTTGAIRNIRMRKL